MVVEELAAVTRGPLRLSLAQPGHPAVTCCMVTGRVEVDGVVRELAWEDVRLQPDDAGDLARQPRASVELVERRITVDGLVLPVWRVTALGFVEHEARAAHDSGMAELGSILSSDGWR